MDEADCYPKLLTKVKKKIRQRNTSNLQHAWAARRQGNVAAALNNRDNDNISVNSSVNSSVSEFVIDNGNRDHPTLGRRTTNTKTLLDEADYYPKLAK